MIEENIKSHEIELLNKNVREEFIPDENQFRKLIENAPDGIAIVGTDGKFKYVSPSAKKIFGYDSEAELVIDPNEATHPDDLINVIKTLEALFVNPSLVLTLQYRFRHKNGEWLWIESTFSAVLNEAEIEGFIINFRSVEERKRIEAELVKKETLYRTLFDLSPAGIMLEDMYGNIIDINDTYLAITGYRREELVGHNVRKIVPPEFLDEVDKNITRIRLGETLIYEISTLRKDGTKNEIELRETLITLPNGEKGIIVVSNDISERKHAEEILRRSENKYREIINGMTETVWVVDNDAFIIDVNNSAVELLGYTRDELLLQGIEQIDKNLKTEDIKHVIRNMPFDKIQIFETEHTSKQGIKIPVEISSSLINYDNKTAILSIARDITERKKIEEKLKMSDRVFNHSVDMLCVAGYDGFFKVLNPAWSKTLGWSTEELLSQPWNDFVYPEDIDITNKFKADLDAGSELCHFENRYKCKDGSFKWLSWNTFPYSEENLIFAVARDVTNEKATEHALHERLELEKLISAISSRFINVKPESLDQEINSALCNIGKITNADRSYLILLSKDGITADNTHEWCKDGVEPQIDKFNGIPVSSVPWFMERLYRFETIHIPSVENLPAEAGSEKELLNALDIKSVVFVPLFSAETLIGIVGFDAVYEKKYWLDEDIILLKMVGEIFANGIDRIKSDEALRKSEKKYRTIFENVQDAYYETSLEGKILSVSPSIELISGGQYHQADLIGRSMNEFYTDIEQRNVILSLLQNKGSVTDHEVYFKNKDGLPISCSISAKLYFDAQGHPEKIIGSLRNITDRKVAEEKLKKSEARLLYAQRVGHIGNWDWDIKSNDLFWSEESKNIFGLTRDDQVTVETFFEAIDPGDIEFVKKSIDDALLQNKQYDIELRLIRPDGHRIVIHAVAEVSFNELGKPVRMFGTMQDITERKKAEAEINFQANMLNIIGQAVTATDLEGKIIYWNKAAEKIYGWTAAELINKNRIDIIASGESESQATVMLNRLKEGIAWSGEIFVKSKNGNIFPVFVTTSPLYNDNNELIGVIATSVDITERTNHLKLIEDSRKQLRALSLKIEDLREEERTAIARELHDELGQLLTAIKIDLQTIAKHPPNKNDTSKHINPVVELVEESIVSIRKLSSDLRPTVLDHLGLVSAMQWYIAEQKKRLNIDFTFNKPPAIGKISKKKIIPVFRVFQELLTNVARHAQASKVKIEIEVVDSTLKLIVSDNGVGMSIDSVDNISSLGILGMKERLSAIGGSLRYSSTPESGTTAEVLVPSIEMDEIV